MKTYHISDLFKTSWDQVSPKEMATVIDMKIKMQRANEQGLHQAAGHYAIMILKALRKNEGLVSKINVEQAVDCINDLEFIHQKWFTFPEIKFSDSTFCNPPTHLKNHTLGQLYWIDSLFSKFLMQEYYDGRAHPPQTPSTMAEMFLDEMIAVIYTHPDQFDEKVITERGKEIGRIINNDYRVCMLYGYANVKEFILAEFPLTFPRLEDEDETQNPVSNKPPVDSEPMWQNILFDLSESPAYPGMDRAKKAPMYEALNYLEKKHKELQRKKS
ncbi:MAG TPA: hypothetical protein VK589_11890 [Chryseolinea sp.]|nr:hypothetical protein [Chryseolinea sp.]